MFGGAAGYIAKDEKEYPELLRAVKDAPSGLYFKGEWSAGLFERCLGVVGSRRMSSYGEKVTRDMIYMLARDGITIVSGFMYGVDATAHSAAVEAGGKTIAVMPCGIERIVPEYQRDLYEAILTKGGLVVSELEGDIGPKKWLFPKRNRIIAGLCRAVLVVEAAKNSGSIVTARLANEYERKVFAVPGNVTSGVSEGALELIKTGQAQMVTSAADILDFFGVGSQPGSEPGVVGLSGEPDSGSFRNVILGLLAKSPLSIEVLQSQLSSHEAVDVQKLGVELSLLELEGRISFKEGKYFVN